MSREPSSKKPNPQILKVFVQEASDILEALEGLFLDLEETPTSRELIDGVMRAAHTLKGSAGTLGVTRLQEAARELEGYLSRQQEQGSKAEDTARLMAVVSTEQRYLREMLLQIKTPAEAEATLAPNTDQAEPVLRRLQTLLERDDPAVNDLFVEHEVLLVRTYGELAEQLGQHIIAFDYPSARETLEVISSGGRPA